jgi:hypothetical protein
LFELSQQQIEIVNSATPRDSHRNVRTEITL